MIRYVVAIAALLATFGGAYAWGRSDGATLAEARLTAAQEASREATAKLETARLAAQVTRDRLTRQLEDAAHADPVSNPVALSADRVRRLNSIR